MSIDDRTGTQAHQLTRAAWRKSSHSGKQGNCVELARTGDGGTAFRDSHDPHGPTLMYPANQMTAFLDAAKEGDFDGQRI